MHNRRTQSLMATSQRCWVRSKLGLFIRIYTYWFFLNVPFEICFSIDFVCVCLQYLCSTITVTAVWGRFNDRTIKFSPYPFQLTPCTYSSQHARCKIPQPPLSTWERWCKQGVCVEMFWHSRYLKVRIKPSRKHERLATKTGSQLKTNLGKM